MMKEKPILFSGEMVRAILAGRKTQTRRFMKPQPILTQNGNEPSLWQWKDCQWVEGGLGFPKSGIIDHSPYVIAGGRLWVRETWRVGEWNCDYSIDIEYRADSLAKTAWLYLQDREKFERLWKQSCDDAKKALGYRDEYKWKPGESPCRWRSSIHMPRWASRITLEVIDVRAERLRNISEDDAQAEGAFMQAKIGDDPVSPLWTMTGEGWRYDSAREAFSAFWDSINAKRPGCSWNDNPFVFVIEFRRLP